MQNFAKRYKTLNVIMNTYNLGHNILELYNVLVKIRLITSKMKRDIRYSKSGIRVTSRIAERLVS